MKSLADVENENKSLTKKEKKLQRIKDILGRDSQLPKKLVNDEVLNCGLSEPSEVLTKGGYTNIKRGWIRRIGKGQRYHAYTYEDNEFHYKWIYLHKDITENKKHRAIRDVLDEKIRLKEFIIKRINIGKKGDVTLNREDRLKALAELGNNKPKRKNLLQRLKEFLST